jgi:hypothetical protein
MKGKWTVLSIIGFACLGHGALLAPEAALTIRVVDDFGKAVVGVPVRVSTYQRTTRGEGFGHDDYKNFIIRTDTNGFAKWTGTSRMPYVPFGAPPTDGYYFGGGDEYRFKEAKGGKWQPWNPTVQLVLKPILNPVPVYFSVVETRVKKANQKFGFDLIAEDWVAPEGKGKLADVEIEVRGYWKTSTDHDSTLIISFPNSNDGIQEFELPRPGTESDLLSPRYAPIQGYNRELQVRDVRRDNDKIWIDDLKKEHGYFLRIRTTTDEQGKVKSAIYGKIQHGFFFSGAVDNTYLKIRALYLNPELNSTNMEFDLKRNLPKPGKR